MTPKRPRQVVRAGRRILYRLLAVNAWSSVLLRAAEHLHRAKHAPPHQPMRC